MGVALWQPGHKFNDPAGGRVTDLDYRLWCEAITRLKGPHSAWQLEPLAAALYKKKYRLFEKLTKLNVVTPPEELIRIAWL